MRKSILVLFLIVAVFSAIFAAGSYGGVFNYLTGADAKTLFPANATDNPSYTVSRHIFDGLVEFTTDMKIVPALAKSWDISKDGTVYTFHLRKGIKFQDGTPFNAQAVKTFFDYVLTHKLRRTSLYKPYIKSVDVVDEYTVAFHLNFPFGGFLHTLAHGAGLIVDPAMIKKYGDNPGELGRHPVGTGPFELVEWKEGEIIKLKANPNYWKGRPYLDGINFKVIPNDMTRLIQVETGGADLTVRVPPIMVKKLKNDKRVNIMVKPSLRVIYLGFNLKKKPFDDVRVRQALNYAINKKELCSVIMQGLATPSDSPLSPLTWGYSSTGGYPYNPEKAKELLKEAGYDANHPLKFELVTPRGRYLNDYETSVAIQAMLKKVNVDVSVRAMEWGSYISYLFSNPKPSDAKYQVFLLGWAPSTGDADWVLRPLFSSTEWPPYGDNNTYYSNPEVDKLIVAGMKESNPEKRKEDYAKAQKLIVQDAPWVFLYNLQQAVATRKDVHGVEILPVEIVLAKNAWIAK
ncbi:glutathione ABC transporter substrate-binding protein [Mesoaciditoga lauensis]|uniref:glutathione ABC transporter substrate-binding protein n=1 Tax=Mesoaciditoga lauensis TaxID=1495039 RepID=UPI0006894F03|nr:glutathione ABC transporter substrate-binding protein [Mesoaciditoga lauensis]